MPRKQPDEPLNLEILQRELEAVALKAFDARDKAQEAGSAALLLSQKIQKERLRILKEPMVI